MMARPSPGADGPIDVDGSEVIGLGISDLYKSFGTQAVLTGIDLEVPVGSITAVLGPSGSGKTTLLRVVAGFERADRGTVTLGRRIVEDAHRALSARTTGNRLCPTGGIALSPPHRGCQCCLRYTSGKPAEVDGTHRVDARAGGPGRTG